MEYAEMRRQQPAHGAGNDSDYLPLPALVIIIDEFSELLSAHPGFIDTFVAIGRLGRSLGIHLLLATQRLEEGRLRGLDAHLSYRIGLRTFSAGESRIVLGVNDAHTLPKEPGYGLARVGGDSITAFRATYVSRRWNGSVASEAAGSSAGLAASPQPSTILRIAIDRLSIDGPCASEVARFVPARTIWLPPLPDVLTMSELNTRTRRLTRDHTCSNEGLQITIGLIDAPRTQRQIPWTIDLRGSAGHVGIIGGPQSGTTTVARSVVTTLTLSRTSDQAQFYVLDMGGSGLGTLERLPHTVAVVHRHEHDRILRLVNEVAVLAEDRREEWLRQGWASVDVARGHGLSDIFVVIDGWHVITTDFPDVADALSLLIADGLSVGIHVIITANRWSAVRPQVRDLLGTKIELSLGDPLESLIDRKLSERIPSRPGRAIVKWKGTSLHALVVHSTNQDIAEVTRIAAQRGDTRVPPLRVLPDVLTREELDPVLPPAIAMGRESVRLSTWSWSTVANPAMLIVGKGESGRTTTLRSLIHGITSAYKPKNFGKKPAEDKDAEGEGSTADATTAADVTTAADTTSTADAPTAAIVVIDPRRTLLAEVPSEYDAGYASTPSAADTVIAQLTTTMNMRLPGDSITPQELKDRSWWSGPEIFLLIDDYDLLTISPSVMSGFISVFPHARDIGVHIVVARRASGMMRAAHDPLLAGMRAINGVVALLSADKDDGPLFGVPLRPALPGRAHIVVNGATSEIHLARAQLSPEDSTEDEDKKYSPIGNDADGTTTVGTDVVDGTTADRNSTEQK
ncbi:FtsK/SpoIIIE domain-containing protein [Corynebacterium sp. SFY-M4]|uniref:FtsK/SpoIIIE domain-containing protein n=3 Tax=Corynebacterium TaxID=1716 RepID=UPI00399AEAA4